MEHTKKFYKIEKGKNRVRYIAIFDKIPEDNPECFKRSKLVYIEEVELEFWRPQSSKANINYIFGSKEDLEREIRVYKAEEVSEAEFESIKRDVKNIVEQTNNLLNIYNSRRYDKEI